MGKLSPKWLLIPQGPSGPQGSPTAQNFLGSEGWVGGQAAAGAELWQEADGS